MCKICGAAYKTTFRNDLGERTNIVEANHVGPYLSFVVVTRHETSPQLFNTKFRLNFSSDMCGDSFMLPVPGSNPPARYPTDMTVGRSSACNMVLDYRTVSTMHAKIMYRGSVDGGKGGFLLQVRGVCIAIFILCCVVL